MYYLSKFNKYNFVLGSDYNITHPKAKYRLLPSTGSLLDTIYILVITKP